MNADALLKKYWSVVILGFIALNAYLDMSGLMQLVGASLMQAPALRGARASPVSSPSQRTADAQAILARNAFDSVTGPLLGTPVAPLPQPPTKPALDDPLAAPPCKGVSAFITTESSDPLSSVAALAGETETQPRLRRVGDLLGSQQVTFIGFNPRENSPAVWLSHGAELCQVLLFHATTASPSRAALAVSAADASLPGGVPPEIAEKIAKVSESEFEIDRQVIDRILENQADLMRPVRVAPELKDGVAVGLRLFGIRPDGLLSRLGLRDGDRIESINGFNLTNPEQALEAYARIRAATELSLKLKRGGAPFSVEYRIK